MAPRNTVINTMLSHIIICIGAVALDYSSSNIKHQASNNNTLEP